MTKDLTQIFAKKNRFMAKFKHKGLDKSYFTKSELSNIKT